MNHLNQVRTRAATAQNYISSKEDILIYAKKLLKAEMPLSLRLMGRCEHLNYFFVSSLMIASWLEPVLVSF